MYERVFKRLLDIIMSGMGIVILAIPMLIVAAVIKIDDHGPAFFSQKRVGIHKRCFQLYKFRSMKLCAPHDVPTHLLGNSREHLTRIGGFLRKTSIDELPQLFQIFSGKMSVVGPRPALWNQYDLIAERDKYGANNVKPGLTGWAQINGRDELDIPVKAKFDGEYVEKMSFLFDCKCFFGTILCVLRHEGVHDSGVYEPKKDKINRKSETVSK